VALQSAATAAIVFAFGVYWRFIRLVPPLDAFIFGDLTDGYLCLWLMEHARSTLFAGQIQEYLNPRIFFPDGHLSIFWSVLLLFPALFYSAFSALGLAPIVAYNLTVYVFIAVGFAGCYYLCWTVDEIARLELNAPRSRFVAVILIPLLAYVAAFSEPRMLYTAHFQNWLSAFVFLGAAACIRFAYFGSAGALSGIVASWVILVFSDPYHAVMFSVIALGTVGLVLYQKGLWFLVHAVCRHLWIPALSILLSAPVLLGYFAVRQDEAQVVKEMETRIWHLFAPPLGSLMLARLKSWGWNPGTHSDESLAYTGLVLGPVVFASAILCVLYVIRGKSHRDRALALSTLAAIGMGALAFAPMPPTVGLALVAGLTAIAGALVASPHQERQANVVLPIVAMAAFFSFATAFGPSDHYRGSEIDSSAWSLFAVAVPGYTAIRAIGRFATVGFTFLLTTVLYVAAFLDGGRQTGRLYAGVALCAVLLTAAVDQTAAPTTNRYDFARLQPNAQSKAFFKGHPGRALVLPANNLSLIPGYMFYFEHIEQTALVNGYSGRLPPRFRQIYTHYDRDLDAAAIVSLTEVGVNQILWDKRFFRRDDLAAKVNATRGAIVFENEYFFVSTLPGTAGSQLAPSVRGLVTEPNPLGGGACAIQRLVGFHPNEDWGAWSETDPSEIVLTRDIVGRFRVRIVAYALNDGFPHQLTIAIGDVRNSIALTTRPKPFELIYAITRPTSRIVLSGITPRAPSDAGILPDSRKLAVGLVKVECQPVP
jgi:hypothetical protein